MAGQANTMQYGNKSGMFDSMANTNALSTGIADTAKQLGAPKVDVNDPASLRAYAAWQAKGGDMAGSQQSLSMGQGVERANQGRTEFEGRQEASAQAEIDKTFVDSGEDELADVLTKLGYTFEAEQLRKGVMPATTALALYTGHDKREAEDAKALVAKATAQAAEQRAIDRHNIFTDKDVDLQAKLTEAKDDAVALTAIRMDLAKQAEDGQWGDPSFIMMMRDGLPMDSKSVYAAYDRAYGNSQEGMLDKNSTRDADGKVEAWILNKGWPNTPEGQAAMKADLAATREKLKGISSQGRLAWVSNQAANKAQRDAGNKKLWQESTATSREFAKDQQELLGDWGELSGEAFAVFSPSTWTGPSPRPSKQWNRNMQLMMANTAESVSFNNPLLSEGQSQDLVLRKFKEIIQSESTEGRRITTKDMNQRMTTWLINQRAKSTGTPASPSGSGMTPEDYLTATQKKEGK